MASTKLILVSVAAFAVAFAALHLGFFNRSRLSDLPVYERYGDAVVRGHRVPYRDFSVEYPPGALPFFVVPSAVAGPGHYVRYRIVFEAGLFVCGALATALAAAVLLREPGPPRRRLVRALLVGLAPLALGSVVLSRFDLWPALLTVAGVAALLARRPRLGLAALGLGFAAKIYPGVLVPIALAYVWRRRGRREAVICAAIAAVVAVAVFLPFVALAPHGVWESLAGQLSRPLQIESLGSGFLLAAHQAWGLPIAKVTSHGSDNLAGPLPHAVATAQGVLAPLALLALWVAFARGPATRERLLRFSAAAVCTFIVLSKVLSPQYLVWLIPLVPLVRGRRGAAATALLVCSLVLTQLWFPRRYLDLAFAFDPRASWLVLARDLVLAALVLVLLFARLRALVVVAAAAAAIGAAAAGVSAPGAPVHTNVLGRTAAASSCRKKPKTPHVRVRTVRYAVHGFESASGGERCVTVTVRAASTQRLFSAAYAEDFDPVNPGRNYLGNGGGCTAPGRPTLTYSFRVPPRARFAIDVEQCSSNRTTPRYALHVSPAA